MKQPKKPGGKPLKAGSRVAKAQKRPNARKAERSNGSPASREETEVARLTRERDEALERQTATSAILSAISNSVADAQPVFDKILESVERLFDATQRVIFLASEDGLLHVGAVHGPNAERIRAIHPVPLKGTASEIAIRNRRPVTYADVLKDADVPPGLRETARRYGENYALVAVPLLWEDRAVGSIVAARTSMQPFNDKECALLRTFADQAVIAIENARLFNETQEALARQIATADVLKVISSSPGDLEPVFKEMLENAMRICEAHFGNLWLCEGDAFRLGALYGAPAAFSEARWREPVVRPGPGTGLDRVARTKQLVHIADLASEQAYIERVPSRVALVELAGARTYLMVPMLKDNELVGSIAIYRQEVRPFSNKQIELVTSFADQAVIAIENARLLSELQTRTRDLSKSLEDLRTAQDRLVQTEKLASLGQLTAGIAHEIKNPLNFVNNFSALSAELIDELDETLAPAPFDRKMREEVGELTQMLKSNLEKVIHHGKRADSIVKNMLLHSREGSGECRSADINALVEESLNLAYHGARAEKPGFNVTLKRELDPDAGEAELYPQEITRALLNLISNGFYAAAQRRSKDGDNFEPVLTATTKNRGRTVEISIRDNGTGIPDEVKEKIFNPFFTTKPSGEGTGLGLSMSHDIIVKQHGGSIDVETKPGLFTEFKIVLPRASQS